MAYVPKNSPQECKNITDVRNEIDSIDEHILKLMGERYKYVQAVVNFKEKTKDSIIAHERREAVIAQRREWAVQNGLSPDAIEEMYRNLINHFISEEMKIAKL